MLAARTSVGGRCLGTYDGDPTDVTKARTPVDFTTAADSPSELLRELWTSLEPEVRVAAMAFDPARFPASIEIVGCE